METIYTSVMSFGKYNDHDTEIAYCGTDYEKAKKACEEYEFSDPHNNYGVIVHWVDGKKVKFDEIIK